MNNYWDVLQNFSKTLINNGDGTYSIRTSGGGGGSLTVQEQDGAPSVSSVTVIKVSNGTLTDDGGGTVSISTGGGGGTPGGADTQLQFNDGGSFGGDAGLAWNKTTDTLVVGNTAGTVLATHAPLTIGADIYPSISFTDDNATEIGVMRRGVIFQGSATATTPLIQFRDKDSTFTGQISLNPASGILVVSSATSLSSSIPVIVSSATFSNTSLTGQIQYNDATAETALFGTTTDLASTVGIIPIATTDIGLVIQGLASQSGNLFQAQISTGVIHTVIDSSALLKSRWDNIITTSTDGLVLENTEAATAGVPAQISPRLRFSGKAWNSTSGSSNIVDWAMDILPTNGSSTSVGSQLLFKRQVNLGGYTTYLTIDSRTASGGGTFLFGGATITNSSSVIPRISLSTTYGQTGTAGSADFRVVRTENALGSGTHRFIELKVASTEKFVVTNDGTLTFEGALDHNGTNLGFYGVAPTPRSSAYTPSNVSADRSYDANSTSIDEIADVLGTLIADLQLTGILG